MKWSLRWPTHGLWANRDFVSLWKAETVSLFGSLISITAISFTAILTLDAGPFQIALIGISEMTPAFLLSLFAGAWVDRLPKRPIMVIADLARALLLGSIPVAALFDVLRIEQLYLVAALASVFTTFFDLAYQAYLPELVDPEQLVEGNSKLTASAAVAEATAFSSAGWLVQVLTAPGAIVVDALSFLWSAYFVSRIEKKEIAQTAEVERRHIREEIAEGVRILAEHPILRSTAVSNLLMAMAYRINGAVYGLFLVNELGFKPGVLGLIYAVGGVSALVGSLYAERVTVWMGLGPAMIAGLVLTGAGQGIIALATGVTAFSVLLLIMQQILADAAATVYQIDEMSVRQAVAPANTLGRISGSMRVLDFGAMLVGATLGGFLGSTVGLRFTVVVASLLFAAGGLWLSRTPVRALRSASLPAAESVPESVPAV